MNVHPIFTPASPSLASPLFDASCDSITSLTTSFVASVVPTLEATTVTEAALGYHRNQQYSITAMTTFTEYEIDPVSNAPAQGGQRSLKGEVGILKESQSFLYRISNGVLDFLFFRSMLKRTVRDCFRAH
jgi:hypothetical protein